MSMIRRRRSRAAALGLGTLVAAILLGGCGDTLQTQPIGPAPFESVLEQARFPVYWAGLRFQGMEATGVLADPSEAVTVRYGDCKVGGQYTCVSPLSIVTSPDNSFVPGGAARARTLRIRGVSAEALQGERTLVLATGGVVVSVYAESPALARAAAREMVPFNEPATPGATLPRALPDTRYARLPMPSQVPAATIPPPSTPAR